MRVAELAHQTTWWWTGTCRKLHESRIMAPFRSRAGRHRLVGLYVTVLAALPVVGWLIGQLWVVPLLLIPYAVGSLLLAVTTQGLLNRPLKSLDERQLHQRRSLFREPYATGASLGLVGGLVLAVATRADDALMMGLLLTVFGLVYGLPSMVLAWRMPADLTDNE
jgi:hypothetical protein